MIKIKEIFGPTLQGEGVFAGMPAIFVRTSGCNMWSGREEDRATSKCPFCDTDFAGGTLMSPSEIADEVYALSGSVHLVVITGGEPTLQPGTEMSDLVERLDSLGYMIQVETNGTVNAPWLKEVAEVTVSPKLPRSECKIDWDLVGSIKVLYPHPNPAVVPKDFVGLGQLYIQPVWGPAGADYDSAVKKVIELSPHAKLSIQTHKITGVR